MIILTILLVYITWLLILWIFNQHKHLNIFEQIGFWFWIALSLFVLEIFLQWLIFDKLSLIFPVITFLIVFSIFIYKSVYEKHYIKEVGESISHTFKFIKKDFFDMSLWKKVTWILIVFYVILKVYMSFFINIHMPTFDEDAVWWWDLKTKVFTENKSLVLDKNNVEFLWSALERNIFAPLTDTYFLLWYNEFKIWLSNIISPLVYLSIILLFFWIFIRKSNLFFALIPIYIFTSLPFVFIHSFWSYFNYISWYFLFVFAFYLSDQVLKLDKKSDINYQILIPLAIFSFLDASIRNESIILMLAIFIIEFWLFYYYVWKKLKFNKYSYILISLIWALIAYIVNIYINSISPQVVWGISSNLSWWVVSRFFDNIAKHWVLTAPFSQSFYHTDYNLLYLLYFISIIFFVFYFKKLSEIKSILLSSIALLFIFCFILFLNVDELWLLTHFSFVRYPIAIIPFLVYIVWYTIYFIFNKHKHDRL